MGHGDKYWNLGFGLPSPAYSDWEGNIMADHGGAVDARNIEEITPAHLEERAIQLIEQ